MPTRDGNQVPPAADAALQESEQRFRLLVDGVKDYAIFMLDPQGNVTSWNAGAERINGYRSDEVLGRHLSIFYTPEDAAAGNAAAELEAAAANGTYEEEGVRVRKGGDRYWASVTVTALRDPAGRLRGFAKVTRDITERRRAQEQLRQNEERLAATLNSIGDAVIATDERGLVTGMNPVAEHLTGWTHAEAAGRPIPEVFKIVNEQTRKPVANPVEKVLREGQVVGLANHTALIARDGRETPIADSGAPIRGLDGIIRGTVLVFRDVGDERRAEDALRASEERFRLLVDGAQDYALFMVDADGKVASWNPGAERIKGYRAEEVIGQPLSIFYPEQAIQAGTPAAELETARREGRFEDEAWRVRKDGSRFWANVVITALRDSDGRLRGYAKLTRDFTARRQAEETARQLEAETAARRAAEEGEARVRRSEERYRQQSEQLAIILAGVADGITAHDADGKLLYANDAAARACAYPDAASLLAAPPGEVVTRFDLYDEAGAPLGWQQLPGRRVIAGEPSATQLMRVHARATGDEWWSLVKATAVRDADGRPYLAVNIMRDVTEQRRGEQAKQFMADATSVLASALDYRDTLERLARLAVPRLADWCSVDMLEGKALVQVAVAHIDPAKVALAQELNRRYPDDPAAPTGAPAVVRTGVSELHPEIDDSLVAAVVKDPALLQIIRDLGLRSSMTVPLLARGRAIGALTLVSAESRRRFGPGDLAFAEELGRRAGLAVDNARLFREATDAVKARDEFLAVAGHELRTPLTALLLQLSSLLRLASKNQEGEWPRVTERLDKTTRHGRRLQKLINELLDVSRVTSGRLALEPETIDLTALVRDTVERLTEESVKAGCRIQLQAPGPVLGMWDRQRLDQVVTNLVSNAIKYGAGCPIELKIEQTEAAAVLTVRDHGIGIDAEHQARIFGRFERAVSDRNYGGLGLGLWIARQIVEAHGGTIRVESAPGRGALFAVGLPR
jgi:PAS domain S-box-containing protein